ncbi:MAG: hypothetical protein MUF14_05695 [Hyphomonadaceae bacterium]|jgi:hypothetical protein|nr:hypothetical protein [Hyphomonadaceae bacterium]
MKVMQFLEMGGWIAVTLAASVFAFAWGYSDGQWAVYQAFESFGCAGLENPEVQR